MFTQRTRKMVTTYSRYWKVRAINTKNDYLDNHMVLLVKIDRTKQYSSPEEIKEEIEYVKKKVRRDYDFDGLLERKDWDLDVEIIEFALPEPGLAIAEL